MTSDDCSGALIIPAPPAATLRLKIDAEALAGNWRTMNRLSGTARAGAAVKANAYGLGVDRVVPILLKAGARDFFVAHWSEVPALLRHVAVSQVSVLHGVVSPDEAAFAQATGVRPTINSLQQARLWDESGGGPCNLMVDTGINRLGVSLSELADPAIAALDVQVLMSHLASADEDGELTTRQLAAFQAASQHVQAKELSIANSAAISLGADFHNDLTRPGLALYGGIPRPELEGRISQVAYPEAATLQIRSLQPGDSVGYNARWTAHAPTRAATVSIGYADGFLRALGPGGSLHHAPSGRSFPIIGRVSMDMVVVDIGEWDLVEGEFLQVPFDIRSLSARSGLSQYELLTTIGSRFAPV